MTQDPNQSTTPRTITAQGMFGLPQGCRVILNRTMSDFMLQLIASAAPAVAGAMENINGQTAVLVTANDDLVEVRFDNVISLPASGGRPAISCKDVWARLRRSGEGVFELSTSATNPDPQGSPLSYVVDGLTAVSEMSKIVFSSGGEPKLRTTPSSGSRGVVSIEAFCAPYLNYVPAFLRSIVPDVVGLVSVTQVCKPQT
jgi:hypothetical protein